VAVASAGPCASLHLAPDRQPCQHPTTRFLQAGCPSCRPTNNVKALKAQKKQKTDKKKQTENKNFEKTDSTVSKTFLPHA